MQFLGLILAFLTLFNLSSACLRFAASYEANPGQNDIKGYLLDNGRKVCNLAFQKYEDDTVYLDCRDATRAWLVHDQVKNKFKMTYTYLDDPATGRWIDFVFEVFWRLKNPDNSQDQRFDLWADKYGDNCEE
jgi:hypothetical protein